MSQEEQRPEPRPGNRGRRLDPDAGPLPKLAYDLNRLREQAGLSLEEMAARTNFAKPTLSKVTDGHKLPSEGPFIAYVTACGGDRDHWLERRRQVAAQLQSASTAIVVSQGAQVGETPRISSSEPAGGKRSTLGRTVGRRPVLIGFIGALALALAAVVVLVVAPQSRSSQPPGPVPYSALPACSGPATAQLQIVSSPDKSALLADLASQYAPRESHGQCLQVVVRAVASGSAMAALASGWTESEGPRPDVWSPASAVWLPLARQRASASAAPLLPAQPGPAIVTTPLTIAMPEPMARALGWPRTQIGWKDLVAWAGDPQFWAHHGHPEWGPFRLGKTNPDYSTSGLNATIGAFFAATGTSDELTLKDIGKPANQAFEGTIEHAAVHYGDTTLTFLANLRRADDAAATASPPAALSYISAVTLEEQAVVSYNLGYPCGAQSSAPGCARQSPPHTKLVAFYPDDGILFSDHPYIELNGLSPAKKAVADDFLAYLHTKAAQDHFAQIGFRTYQDQPNTQETPRNGALPDTKITPLPLPQPAVLDRILTTWSSLRKPANVLLLIDISGSMDETVTGTGKTKIALVQAAAPVLLNGFTDSDRVGLWSFSAAAALGGTLDYQPLVPVGPMSDRLGTGTRRARLAANINALQPTGATGLYNTAAAAVAALRAQYNPDAINAVVLLTDGRNETNGGLSLQQLLAQLTAPTQPLVRVFTIAYGSEADQADTGGRTVLQEISNATEAQSYDAKDPTTIADVLINVISNF